jgi:hypothetical protein
VLNDGRIVAVGKAFYKNSDHRPVGMGTVSFSADGSGAGSSFKNLGSGDAFAPAYVDYGLQNGGGVTSVVAGPDGGFATSAWSIHTGTVVEVFPRSGPSITQGGNLLDTFPFELPYHDECYAVGYTPRGSVVYTGAAQQVDYSNDPFPRGWYVFFLNGSTPSDTGLGAGRCITVQPDDRILVGSGAVIRRFQNSSTPDPGFQIPAGLGANFQSLLMQPDGKLLAAGGGIWRFETGVSYPEIAVEQPAGTDLTDDAAALALGIVTVGIPVSREFTVKNPSDTVLKIDRVYFDGAAAARFSATGRPSSVPAHGAATFTVTWTPAAPGPAAAAMHIVSNDYDENWFDIALTGHGRPAGPEMQIRRNGGAELTDGGTGLSFTFGGEPLSLTLTNIGSEVLSGINTAIEGPHAADFLIDTAPPSSLATDEAVTVEVSFAPTATGQRTATLRIASNDADENPFDINLQGYRPTVLEAWRQTHFGSIANTGPGADHADPDGDGQVNLIEFATQGHPMEFTAPPGVLTVNGAILEYTYTRPKAGLTELSYRPEVSGSLSTVWTTIAVVSTVQSDDGVTQSVRVTAPAGTGNRFLRLKVTRL